MASAEFSLKSSPVRRTLEQRLIDDLKVGLTRSGLDGFKVEKHAGRIIIRAISNADTAARSCARVFGVAYAAPAVMLHASMDRVLETIAQFAKEALDPGQSFAIRAHRATASPLSRREVEIRGGSDVLGALKDRGVKVNLETPDVTIFVDLADDRAYVYRERLLGPGGLPLSSQWRMLGVLDSGPLSILAAYAMMRRGCLVELLIPLSNLIPSFSRDQQFLLAQKLRGLVTRPSYRAFTFEFERSFGGAGTSSLGYAGARRLVRLVGMRLAREKKLKGLVFSDVAGDVAMLQQEPVRAAGMNLPVFQPLIGLNREDLVGMCKEIGIPEQEFLSQMELETHESDSRTVDFSKHLNETEFEQISL